ncbi:hypothetical protein BN2475_130021 [Paraburkholderia ribeironis]|uniref:Uncharacterized protein n=1 Tax=Paraburkholderia ribeironis TaxID=1247936 RepID=A0A1N7RS51_9BURK|nr:hypothetical protein BN2475_130021 [Paraburkholderia ribeironis]
MRSRPTRPRRRQLASAAGACHRGGKATLEIPTRDGIARQKRSKPMPRVTDGKANLPAGTRITTYTVGDEAAAQASVAWLAMLQRTPVVGFSPKNLTRCANLAACPSTMER